jgi:diaminopimelate epimerase
MRVTLPGGVLTIEVGDESAPTRMTGPARHVFDGTFVF